MERPPVKHDGAVLEPQATGCEPRHGAGQDNVLAHVDAVLGSRVFEQLFRLPPQYFHHRPTGIIAARLQGIETIREFVSSAAMRRATVSEALPGACGTIMRIGRDG